MEETQMVELGFIHGRFQLFHNDHLNYALLAKAQCQKLIVGITSPENATLIREDIDPHRSEAASNPFTYYERFNMVKLALLEAGIKREDFDLMAEKACRYGDIKGFKTLTKEDVVRIFEMCL